ncbi:glycosyl hydrolase 115 family protein [Saccharicrinis sp. FJH54]|uniref:glycosyl hydrolase 115 family protein n=1 Tax=Saccharicrinis sp. FJH54 TaxID=3344665 RepID=UPI0035D41D35
MKHLFFIISAILLFSCSSKPKEISYLVASHDNPVTIYVDPKADALVLWAVNDLATDLHSITGSEVSVETTTNRPTGKGIVVGQVTDDLIASFKLDHVKNIAGRWETFHIDRQNNTLVIAGSDIRGTVYGVFDVADKLGISPWKWWADVKPIRQDSLLFSMPEQGYTEGPSVRYRGIFLNDEDWGLQPWAAKTFEPETGDIGPKTYEKIFQLLLRLKANTIWPAMHSCTKAFYRIPGNNEMAQKYHIVVGTSHCEPMLRNNVDEWNHDLYGDYNFFTNQGAVCDYWQDRVNDVSGAENIFTLGMRGIHDGKMQGGGSDSAQVKMLEQIIDTQRQMLKDSKQKDIKDIPQTIVLYKEVLDLYNKGMQIPDDVTIMWCDDNYGYIRRLSNDEENKRSGSSGVYYHLSYWGRPHDYLWLSTTQPALIWQEMKKAYENGADRIWIANVGDLKPAEYNMELFLDLAWDVNAYDNTNLRAHMLHWATREFGQEAAEPVTDVMNEYYRLAFLRKPEYMGWSQTEPSTPVHPTAFNPEEQKRRLNQYNALVKKVDDIAHLIPENRKDAWFQLVEYPVKGAALMNRKFLFYQLAMESDVPAKRQALLEQSKASYDAIKSLTQYYNTEMSGGKWNRMMDMSPRNLNVFKMPDWPESEVPDAFRDTDTTPQRIFIQASDYVNYDNEDNYRWESVAGLGYSNSAVTLMPFKHKTFDADMMPWIEYSFNAPVKGEFELQIRCLPTHSNTFDQKLSVRVDNLPVQTFDLNTWGRSKAWKINTLRNSQIVTVKSQAKHIGPHIIRLWVNQTGIIIDQLAVDFTPDQPFYEIPYTKE